ncbi:MAG: hypothetical protein H6722_29125 [Sandaracinus sp.]|nr:hypothetical protein [Sandaracinus sp.]MCB9616517.1 hypothetical protein [Sandaracinus sp.]
MRRRGMGLVFWVVLACGGEEPASTPASTAEAPAPEAAGHATNATSETPGSETPGSETPGSETTPPEAAEASEATPLVGISALVASDAYTCALASRRVQCVGVPPSTLPDGEHDLVAALSGAVCVATRDGDGVRCWGGDAEMLGYEGMLERWERECGDDAADDCVEGREARWTAERRRDGLILPITGVKSLAGSTSTVCALGAEGRVVCWDLMGETTRPLRQLTIADAVELAVADGAVCARLEGGGVQCWEEWGDPDERVRPRPVRGVEGAVRLAVGSELSCAWNAANEARCWGFDWAFDGDLPERGSGRVRGFDGFESFAFSGVEGFGCGLRSGRVECLGDPRFGQLGRAGVPGDARRFRASEPGFPSVANPRRVVVGSHHTCALDASDRLHCWGSAAEGALGEARKRTRFGAETVPNVRAEALAVTYQRTCARTSAGWQCWGPESSSDRRGEPWRVQPGDFPSESVPFGWAGRVCARFGESLRCPTETLEGRLLANGPPCRLTAEGALECRERDTWNRLEGSAGWQWISGYGSSVTVGKPGELQRVRTTSGRFEVRDTIATPPDVQEVFEVSSRTCVRRTSVVSCWRDGAWVDLATPPLVEVGAGSGHACGRSASGEVWCWGNNHEAQLGRETPTSSEAPVRVADLGVASALVVGRSHACAIVEEGAVRCWGASHEGQLGVDPGTWMPRPVPMAMGPGVAAETGATTETVPAATEAAATEPAAAGTATTTP